VALALFIAFHFHPAFGWEHGSRLWWKVLDLVVNVRTFLDGGMGPILATFAAFSAGVVASPCAVPLIRKSLLVRWFIAFLSALVFLGVFFSLLVIGPSRLGLGGIYLLLSAACNFTGILLCRYEGPHQEVLRKLSGI
jgi:hypothetical protein